MYCSVIPLTASIDYRPVWYDVPEHLQQDIQPGQIVRIPFGRKFLLAISARIHSLAPSYKVRSIVCIEQSQSVVPLYLIEIIVRIAQLTLIPIHRIAGLFFPRVLISYFCKSVPNIPLKHSTQDTVCFPVVHTNQKPLSAYVRDFFISYKNMQSAVILPDMFALRVLRSQLTDLDIEWVEENITPAKRRDVWLRIADGKSRQIIGTRKLLYYNLFQASAILSIEDSLNPKAYFFDFHLLYADILESITHYLKGLHIVLFSESPHPTLMAQWLSEQKDIIYTHKYLGMNLFEIFKKTHFLQSDFTH